MMKKSWVVAAFVLLGCIVGGVIAVGQWDFAKMETNEYEISEKFSDIAVSTDDADLVFAVSENGKCVVKCEEESKQKHFVTVKENTLAIDLVDDQKWFERIGIHFAAPRITVYLPKGEYNDLLIRDDTGDVQIPKDFTFKSADISLSTGEVGFYASVSESIKIKGSTGDVRVENISVGSLDFAVTTGEITLSNVDCRGDADVEVTTGKTQLTQIACKNLASNGSTGSVFLTSVNVAEKLSVSRTTGNVKFDSSDAGEISVKTSTGTVSGSLLTEKVFLVKSGTGKVEVPQTISGGKCEIVTSTGNIKIALK